MRLFAVIAFLFLFSPLFSQTITSGAGVCYVTGNPNYITAITAGQSIARCKIAYDNSIDKFWFFNEATGAWYLLESLVGSSAVTLEKVTASKTYNNTTVLLPTYIVFDTSSGNININLPATETSGKSFFFKKVYSNNKLTITGDFYGGAPYYEFWGDGDGTLLYDGVSNKWHIDF